MQSVSNKNTVDGYTIIKSLGKGSYCKVKLAKGPDGKLVAIKTPKKRGALP